MNNKNFSSVFSMRSQGIVGSIWASVALVAAALPIVCHTMGYQASQVANKVMTAGPIEDALEYLLWLLRNA